ncbi:hypothetical protein LJR069_004448 [Variovorax paradoxus]|uniref:hypothetical protein n=1 Tax=Variovorax paradoxus TaxID=34073 RepID=UPI003ECD6E98
MGELVDLGGLEGDLARERLDRSVLGLEQALLLGEAIDEPEGHLVQLLCTETLQLFGIHHEHVGCRVIARLSSAFAAIAGQRAITRR